MRGEGNIFIYGIGCSILSQQLVKELLAEQWGMSDVMGVTAVAAALGMGCLNSLPFFPGICVETSMSYLMLPLVCGIVIVVLGVLAIFAPLPKVERVGKGESFINNLKSAHFSLESVVLILIGFTCTATIQFWLNCAQTFGTDVAEIASEDVSMMQTYYSAGTLVALFVTSILITKFKQLRFLVIYPVVSLVNVGACLHGQEPADLLCRRVRDRLCGSRRSAPDGDSCRKRPVPEDQRYAYKKCKIRCTAEKCRHIQISNTARQAACGRSLHRTDLSGTLLSCG